jgi:hypothetical protein
MDYDPVMVLVTETGSAERLADFSLVVMDSSECISANWKDEKPLL